MVSKKPVALPRKAVVSKKPYPGRQKQKESRCRVIPHISHPLTALASLQVCVWYCGGVVGWRGREAMMPTTHTHTHTVTPHPCK